MKSQDALRALAEVTAYQWGMVTSAQASMHGITRLALSRLAEAGHLKRLAHGVYLSAGAPDDQFEDLHAAWLSTDPRRMGEARIRDQTDGVVIASASAARLHDIGDLWANPHEFVASTRRQSQRKEIRYRRRALDPQDVTLVEGLPAMTMERTIADLVEEVGDLSLVADALRDAARKRDLDLVRLRGLFAPLAERNGFRRGDGDALLTRLMEIAGLDLDTVARRVAADASLGSRVAANYVRGLSKEDLDRLVMTPEMQQTMRSIQESVAALAQSLMTPQLASAQLVNSDTMREFSRAWGKALSDSIALNPATLAAIREARNAVVDG